MSTKKWSQYLDERAATRSPAEAELFEAASKHFAQVAKDLNVGEGLVAIRNAAGLSQGELAARSGIDQGDISRIERGIANPTLHTLERLGDAVGCEVAWVPKPAAAGDREHTARSR
jgi:ribosome-binding protein aMBF1 (putative translation factor)